MNKFYKTAALEEYLNYVKPFSSKMNDMELVYSHTEGVELDDKDSLKIGIDRNMPLSYDYRFIRTFFLGGLDVREATDNTKVRATNNDLNFLVTNFSTSADEVFWEFALSGIGQDTRVSIGLIELAAEQITPLWAKSTIGDPSILGDGDILIEGGRLIMGADEGDIGDSIVLTMGVERGSSELVVYSNGVRFGEVQTSIPIKFSAYILFEDGGDVTFEVRRPQYNITGMNRL